MKKTFAWLTIFSFAFHILPFGSVSAQPPAQAEPKKIFLAVMELDNKGGLTDQECSLLSDNVRQELFSSGRYRVVDRKNMDQILNEQGFQLTGCTSQECAVQVGKLLGVEKMVVGSIGKLGQKFMLNLQMLNIETGEIDSMASDECSCTVENLSEKIRVLARGVSAGSELGKAPIPVAEKPAAAEGKSSRPWSKKAWVWALVAGVLIAGGGGYGIYALTSGGGSHTGIEINY